MPCVLMKILSHASAKKKTKMKDKKLKGFKFCTFMGRFQMTSTCRLIVFYYGIPYATDAEDWAVDADYSVQLNSGRMNGEMKTNFPLPVVYHHHTPSPATTQPAKRRSVIVIFSVWDSSTSHALIGQCQSRGSLETGRQGNCDMKRGPPWGGIELEDG